MRWVLPHDLGAVALVAVAQAALASVRLGAIGMTTPSTEEVVREAVEHSYQTGIHRLRDEALTALTALVKERDEAVAALDNSRWETRRAVGERNEAMARIVELEDNEAGMLGRLNNLRAENARLRAALEEAWALFGVSDTIEPEHLLPDDDFDRWCIAVKGLLALSTNTEGSGGFSFAEDIPINTEGEE